MVNETKKVIMEVKNINLRFGGVIAIKGVSFDIQEGEIRAIIGPNGAGKSSICLLYTSPSPRDRSLSRMPSSA